MKTTTAKLGILLLPLMTVFPSQSSDSVTGSAQAFLLDGLSIIFSDDLDFGVILPPAEGDTVTISESTTSPSIVAAGDSVLSGTYSRGIFTITGTPNTTATVQISESTTLSGPGDAMTVDNFAANRTMPYLGETGSTEIIVGARLSVNASQTPGDYTGTYAVTVAYQ